MPKDDPPYPNRLREYRVGQTALSQARLAHQCNLLAKNDPHQYSHVSISTIKALEAGRRQPLPKTALTLATIFGTTIPNLFPLGCADPNRNPEGITRIAPNRPRGGRPRKP